MTLLPAAPAISPLVSAGLGLAKGVLGFLGGRSKAKRQNALEMQKFVRLRKAAEAGGFHPLEALRSGQQVNATARPGIMSSLANSNAFDALEDEITGEGAKQRKREQVEDEIRERELDKQRYDVAQQQITKPSGTRTRPTLGGPQVQSTSPGAPTYAMSDDDMGRYQPEELAMKNATEGTVGEWVNEIADRNSLPGLWPTDEFLENSQKPVLEQFDWKYPSWTRPAANPAYSQIKRPTLGTSWQQR